MDSTADSTGAGSAHGADLPSVTVLLATKDGTPHLGELLGSIAAQSHPVSQILVSDDGSSDATVDLVTSTATERGLDLTVVDTVAVGGAAANFARLMQAASDLAPTAFYAFADQDDIWHPRKVEQSLQALGDPATQSIARAVYHDARVVDASGVVVHRSHLTHRRLARTPPPPARLLMQNPASGNCITFNRALLDAAVPVPDDAPMHDWWIALTAAHVGELQCLDQTLIDYRQHSDNERGAAGMNPRRVAAEVGRAVRSFDRSRVNDRFALAAAFMKANPDATGHPAAQLLHVRSLPIGRRQIALLQGGFLHAGVLRNLAMLAYV